MPGDVAQVDFEKYWNAHLRMTGSIPRRACRAFTPGVQLLLQPEEDLFSVAPAVYPLHHRFARLPALSIYNITLPLPIMSHIKRGTLP